MNKDVQYEVLKSEHVDRCLELIYDQFITRETLCKCFNMKKSDFGNHFDDLLKKAVEEEKSFVAIQNDRIVGLRCNFEKHITKDIENEISDTSTTADNIESEQNPVGDFLKNIKSKATKIIMDKSCHTYLDFELVVVHENSCRMGIAQNMVELSINLAKNLNFDGILTIATTPKSIKMFEKLNFVTLLTMEGENLLNELPELKTVEHDNIIIRAMFKNLRE